MFRKFSNTRTARSTSKISSQANQGSSTVSKRETLHDEIKIDEAILWRVLRKNDTF